MKSGFTKSVLFRCDAGENVGGGHLIRCLAFAEALTEAGFICSFLCNEQAWDFPLLARAGYKKIQETALKKQHFSYIVVDHYGLDAAYERALRPYCNQLIVIDDLANRLHDCDILIDFSPSRKNSDYQNLVPVNCKILSGLDYIIMRKAFLRPQKQQHLSQDLRRVFVTMGSIDGGHNLPGVLEYLEMLSPSIDIDVLLSHKAKTLEQVRPMASASHHRVHLHIDIDNPWEIMQRADVAITSGGMTCLEILCLQIPLISMVIADNQVENVTYLAQQEYLKQVKNPAELREIDLKSFVLKNDLKKLTVPERLRIMDYFE